MQDHGTLATSLEVFDVCAGDDELQEPLIPGDHLEEADKDHDRSTAGQLVPHSINKIDWDQLLCSLVASCQLGWEAVRGLPLSLLLASCCSALLLVTAAVR